MACTTYVTNYIGVAQKLTFIHDTGIDLDGTDTIRAYIVDEDDNGQFVSATQVGSTQSIAAVIPESTLTAGSWTCQSAITRSGSTIPLYGRPVNFTVTAIP